MGVIYMVRNKINNKCYFGQTAQKGGFDERYRNSFPKNTHNDHIKRAIEKYGWENFEVVKEFDKAETLEELNDLEEMYIKMWDTVNKNYGYNKKHGGDNKKYTEESKRKISDSLKELYKNGVDVDPEEDGNYLINVSEDTTVIKLKAIANNEYANVKIFITPNGRR